MGQSIEEVMTSDPRTVDAGDSVVDAARVMAEADIGSVIVTENDEVCGIATDRDIAVRVVAEGKDPSSTKVGEFCSRETATLTPDQSVEDAIKAMEDKNVRRLPVVQDGRAVGIVSLGDLAMERDKDYALADISSAPPNN